MLPGSPFSMFEVWVKSLLKSVFFSKGVRTAMKAWDTSGDGRPWSVELDVRGLGRH